MSTGRQWTWESEDEVWNGGSNSAAECNIRKQAARRKKRPRIHRSAYADSAPSLIATTASTSVPTSMNVFTTWSLQR